ncbi:hypothetical protein IC582_025948 [Cucumis melo]
MRMFTPARKRLMRDFKRLQQDPPVGISGAPQDNNIMLWNAAIFGPDDTPWDGGIVECGHYVMRYMRKIVSKDTSIIIDAIDTINSYSQLELDEVRVEWAEFLTRYI